MHLGNYLALVHRAERGLEDGLRQVGEKHKDEPDIADLCHHFAAQCERHAERVQPFMEHYKGRAPEEPERLHSELFKGAREGGLALLRDLHDIYLMATEVEIAWDVIGQAAQGAHDKELFAIVEECDNETERLIKWARTRMNQAAPQSLLVAS
jgi:hypothetical protein